MKSKNKLLLILLIATKSTAIAFADETVNGKLTVTGSMELFSGYEKLYWGSTHSGSTDHRNYLAPIKADGSGFDWNKEFGFHHHHQAWYFESNLGIGTVNPSSLLELYKISASGSSVTPLLELTNSIIEPASGDGQSVEFHNLWASSAPRAGIEMRYVGSCTDSSLVFRTRSGSNYNESMLIDNNGNVGIGTDTPTHELSVNGTVQAKEVIVETGWSDFVFDDHYKLRSLEEVEAHIEEHGHLPDVPSAAVVESEGLSVGEAQKIMMQKIEELTLYVIAQQKEINELKSKLSQQNARYNSE